MRRFRVCILLAASLAVGACKKERKQAEEETAAEEPAPAGATQPRAEPSEPPVIREANLNLEIIDEQVGSGAEAVPGKTVVVHYTGTLQANGKKFDSSVDRGEPFSCQLGGGQVIQGWDQGVKGMKVGGKRKLIIPPDMAYGARGFPPVIPANSTLVFEIELREVK